MDGVDHCDQLRRSEIFRILVSHLKRLVQERDEYAQVFEKLVLSLIETNLILVAATHSLDNKRHVTELIVLFVSHELVDELNQL